MIWTEQSLFLMVITTDWMTLRYNYKKSFLVLIQTGKNP